MASPAEATSRASRLVGYLCPACDALHGTDSGALLCTCGSPLFARYRLDAPSDTRQIAPRPRGMWRWAEWLPVRDAAARVSLGEGDTPLLPVPRLGEALGVPRLLVKDEGRNPTGTFKARGLAVAVSLAKEAGVRTIALPSAGNAGGAASAYAAAAGLACRVVFPEGTPRACVEEARAHGAEVRMAGRHIGEAAAALRADPPPGPWRDVSTFREPGRVEGKKTIALEIFEALRDGELQALVFPTGGGTGIVAARRAIEEQEGLGRRGLAGRPKLFAVQGTGCAPVVQAWEAGRDRPEPWPDPTGPPGLRVPDPLAGPLILRAIRETGGAAVAIRPEEVAKAQSDAARLAGLSPGLESAAALAAVAVLRRRALLAEGDPVVVVLTGDRLKDP
ncbi:MAG: threonine synthase [Planctomycetales bacterium]|nr:threonine synthase [Planctomycetales bacterium]